MGVSSIVSAGCSSCDRSQVGGRRQTNAGSNGITSSEAWDLDHMEHSRTRRRDGCFGQRRQFLEHFWQCVCFSVLCRGGGRSLHTSARRRSSIGTRFFLCSCWSTVEPRRFRLQTHQLKNKLNNELTHRTTGLLLHSTKHQDNHESELKEQSRVAIWMPRQR